MIIDDRDLGSGPLQALLQQQQQNRALGMNAPLGTMAFSSYPPHGFTTSTSDGKSGRPSQAPPSSTSSSNHSTSPFLRNEGAYSFRRGSSPDFGAGGGGSGGWSSVMNGRGRSRWVFVAAGAALLLLLHAHFYRPPKDNGSNGPPPGWNADLPHLPPQSQPSLPIQPLAHPASAPLAQPLAKPAELEPGNKWTNAHPAPQGSGSLDNSRQEPPEDVEIPLLLPEDAYIQPRRELRPTWPDPWEDLPEEWQGRNWLSSGRWTKQDAAMDGQEEQQQRPPPARYLMKAFEWAAERAKSLQSRLTKSPGTGFDLTTGRPAMISRDNLFVPDDYVPPKLKVSELEKGRGGVQELPRVQFAGMWENLKESVENEERRRQWVKNAFRHCWEGYKRHAWGHDELKPVTNGSSDNYNGYGASIVDNLDTLLIMGLNNEYNLARAHVEQIDWTYLSPSQVPYSEHLPDLEDLELPMDGTSPVDSRPHNDEKAKRQWGRPGATKYYTAGMWESPQTIPTFETTIRYLGGLLSAYDVSHDPLMLARAVELGDWILPALSTKHGLAVGRYTLGSNPFGGESGRGILSEVGSLSMEFTRLSMLTGDEAYYQAVQRSTDTLDHGFTPAESANRGTSSLQSRLGTLLPAYVDPAYPDALTGETSFGGLSDSYYEYLIKEYQLLGGSSSQYSRMYSDAIDSAQKYLVQRVAVVPGREDLTIIGTMAWGMFTPRLEHLTCFAGGMLGLGSRLLKRAADMGTAINVTEACAWAYESTATGVGPEVLTFYNANDRSRYEIVDNPNGEGKARKPRGRPIGVKSSTPSYIGRPETIESIFYMYRLTGDRRWQDQGWKMFTSWVEHGLGPSGFHSIANVREIKSSSQDSMESFVMAETLKYYYLLFSPPDYFSLDDWVFNTEAHPFRIPKPSPTPFTSLWNGPPTKGSSAASFASTVGEGTTVQKWWRIQQAAKLPATLLNTPPPSQYNPAILPRPEGWGPVPLDELAQAQREVEAATVKPRHRMDVAADAQAHEAKRNTKESASGSADNERARIPPAS